MLRWEKIYWPEKQYENAHTHTHKHTHTYWTIEKGEYVNICFLNDTMNSPIFNIVSHLRKILELGDTK